MNELINPKEALQKDNRFALCASVRIFPPIEIHEDNWRAVELLSGKTFVLSTIGAMILISFAGENTVDEAIQLVQTETMLPTANLLIAIKELVEAELLIPSQSRNTVHDFAKQLFQLWSRYGWLEACDHHLAAYDYPFFDYAIPDDVAADIEGMKQYHSVSPDTNRTKSYSKVLNIISCPSTREVLDTLTCSFADYLAGKHTRSPIDSAVILQVFSATFGKLRERMIRNYEAPPLLRKTSPSGGSRHPTEGYLFALSVNGLEPGIYHFCAGSNELEMLLELAPHGRMLKRILIGPYWAPFQPAAFAVFTSVFERNMYRYRQPRTFRSIFLELGHLCCTFEVIAKGLGLRVFLQHGINDEALERLIGLDPLEEGVLFAAAIGEGGDDQ